MKTICEKTRTLMRAGADKSPVVSKGAGSTRDCYLQSISRSVVSDSL